MLVTLMLRLCVAVGLCRSPEREGEYVNLKVDLQGFSSKTAYRHSKLKALLEPVDDRCVLLHEEVLVRHGTRFPGASEINRVQMIHQKITRSHVRSILPKSFLNWKMPFMLKKQDALASVGYEEMILMGHRFRKKMNGPTSSKELVKQVKVISSSVPRSKMSAVTFLKAFLDNSFTEKEITKMVTENDKQIRFYDDCPFYLKSVLNGKSSKVEFNRFMNGYEVRRIIKNIKQRWRLTDIDLTADDVSTLYEMCGYEIATNLSSYMRPHECPVSPAGDGLTVCPFVHKFAVKEMSPLCTLFERNHYPVFEYLEDLYHYWTQSYASEINWLQACSLMSPMLEYMMKAARSHQTAVRTSRRAHRTSSTADHLLYDWSNHHPRVVFWFGHAETLLPIITLLGLFNQTSPMKANSFKHRYADLADSKKRFSTFRVSNISPFSGNVALELHSCPHLAKGTSSGYRIRVKVNEKAVSWPLSDSGDSSTSLETFTRHMNLCLPEKYDHHSVCVKGMSSMQLHEMRKRGDEL